MKEFAEVILVDKAEKVAYEVTLNQSSPVFIGHFPEQPVVPGVLLMKVVSDCVEAFLGKRMKLVSSRNIKFLVLIDPGERPKFRVELDLKEKDEGLVHVKSTALDQDTILFKFDGKYQPEI